MAKLPIIESTKEILGGIPVFSGTRVPVKTLIDYLEAGDRLSDFLEDFPTVTRDQALQALELAKEALLNSGCPKSRASAQAGSGDPDATAQ